MKTPGARRLPMALPMTLLIALLTLPTALLTGCASSRVPRGSQVPAARLAATIVPGSTTRAQLLAALGRTHALVFDSGFEVWVYQSPAAGGRFAEFVVLIDPSGMVAATRQAAAVLP